jgi:hypothetical protein
MRCPVCRAEVDLGPNCRRCRADLTLLFDLESQHARGLRAAGWYLARGQGQPAVALAQGAQALRLDPVTQRLAALGHLVQRDFARAWQIYTSMIPRPQQPFLSQKPSST